MSQSDAQGRVIGLGPVICLFAVHAFVSMAIPLVALLFAVGLIDWLLPLPRRVEDIFGWVFLFTVGFVLGFFPNRVLLRSEGCRIWVLGLLWLVVGIWSSVHYYDPRWSGGCSVAQDVLNAFIVMGSKCEGGESGLYGFFFTMPAVGSIAYSFGSWIALRVGPRGKRLAPSDHST